MRYIRTKDGIVDISNYIKKDFYYQDAKTFYYQDTKTPDYIGKEKIIKEAGTIEELCDEFVVREFHFGDSFPIKTSPHNSYNTYPLLESAKEHYENLSKYRGRSLQDLYAAIWTDKGLIYVAKMNNKGELELL